MTFEGGFSFHLFGENVADGFVVLSQNGGRLSTIVPALIGLATHSLHDSYRELWGNVIARN